VTGIIIQLVIVSEQCEGKSKKTDESDEFDSTDDVLNMDLYDWNELPGVKRRNAKPQ
jgi:hypothetical protein